MRHPYYHHLAPGVGASTLDRPGLVLGPSLEAHYLPQITAHPKVGWVTAPRRLTPCRGSGVAVVAVARARSGAPGETKRASSPASSS